MAVGAGVVFGSAGPAGGDPVDGPLGPRTPAYGTSDLGRSIFVSDLNGSGQALGYGPGQGGNMRALLWSALNNQGQLAGTSWSDSSGQHVTLWDHGQPTQLPATGYDSVTVDHLNDAGIIAGAGLFTDSARDALIWQPAPRHSPRPPPQPAPQRHDPASGGSP